MLKKEEIINGQLVYDNGNKEYGYIQDVGNAREKGDRGISTTPDNEYSYSVVDIVSNEVEEGICEHSHMTSVRLSVATQKDIDIYLATLESDAMLALGKAKKYYNNIQDAINRFDKMKTKDDDSIIKIS